MFQGLFYLVYHHMVIWGHACPNGVPFLLPYLNNETYHIGVIFRCSLDLPSQLLPLENGEPVSIVAIRSHIQDYIDRGVPCVDDLKQNFLLKYLNPNISWCSTLSAALSTPARTDQMFSDATQIAHPLSFS